MAYNSYLRTLFFSFTCISFSRLKGNIQRCLDLKENRALQLCKIIRHADVLYVWTLNSETAGIISVTKHEKETMRGAIVLHLCIFSFRRHVIGLQRVLIFFERYKLEKFN